MTFTAAGLRSCRCSWSLFANIGQIPKFEKLIATTEAGNLGSIILPGHIQLKAIYKENADTIAGI
jgi:type IV secretion system protein VirD4